MAELDQFGWLACRHRFVLREVADQDVGIQSDHRRLRLAVALAASMASIVTGRRRDLAMLVMPGRQALSAAPRCHRDARRI
jgi:hypothetical protein